MTCFALLSTYRRLRASLGRVAQARLGRAAILALLLVLLLPATDVRAQSPVSSLIERAEQAGADADLMRTVASRAEKNGLDADATADLLRPTVALAEKKLPTTPLLNKTLEGLAKRVPADRMTPVLQQLQSHTQAAGTLVSKWQQQESTQQLLDSKGGSTADRDQLIATIAEARQQDLPLKHIEQFLNALPDAVPDRSVSLADVGTAVSVMADLPGERTNPKGTRRLLTTALNAGYDAASLRQLPAALEQAQRTSNRPASALTRDAANAIAGGAPSDRMLRTLARGKVPGGPPSTMGPDAPGTVPGQGKPPGRDGRSPAASQPNNGGNANNPGGGPGDNPGGGP